MLDLDQRFLSEAHQLKIPAAYLHGGLLDVMVGGSSSTVKEMVSTHIIIQAPSPTKKGLPCL